ncbi:hypothetical protein [Rhodococcoides fascians]|nr:hypothetical protein [Rhodococcus fascians]
MVFLPLEARDVAATQAAGQHVQGPAEICDVRQRELALLEGFRRSKNVR